MKLRTSLTDVAFAVTDSELLSELGWNIWDNDRDLEKGLLEEGTMRNMINMKLKSKVLKEGNIIINDRGFI
ncbi:hypothetical protein [Clostridium estertheticum]|uniref:Uncharacterized protein n=1 Tax=Clostridium estertheticum subsp. estertheticum TaxID=1552 RepID=A0A1J0GCD5_9CLOT|nr:hypothetical protein [Clostridium estertheticum]APC38939.1 hypothetical protein A7L45_02085 [Clostridium estertheticum subsp. estertheticum]MBZ9615110.1 hypothetical protein [Clostridium estertheticum subsp. laramiense]WAG75008.1 hypothetical protein LL032_06020 [Clostridium estertheticum]